MSHHYSPNNYGGYGYTSYPGDYEDTAIYYTEPLPTNLAYQPQQAHMPQNGEAEARRSASNWKITAAAFALFAFAVMFGAMSHMYVQANSLNQQMESRFADKADADASISGTCDDPLVKKLNVRNDPCATFKSNGTFKHTLVVQNNQVHIIRIGTFDDNSSFVIEDQIKSMDRSYENKSIVYNIPSKTRLGDLNVVTYLAH